MNNSLADIWAVVTRPEHQAGGLCQAIETHGGNVIRWPLLKIEPIVESSETEQNINQLQNYDFVIFISVNAVKFGLAAITKHQQSLHDPSPNNPGPNSDMNSGQNLGQNPDVFAVGKATAAALQEAGINQVNMPQVASSDGLLAMPQLSQTNAVGKRCLIFRGKGGNETLAKVLQQRKLETVDYAEIYQRIDNQPDPAIIENHWQKKQLDIIIVTSCAGLDNLFAILEKKNHAQLCSTTLLTVSSRVTDYAHKLDFHGQILTAKSANDQDIIETMQDWYQQRNLYE